MDVRSDYYLPTTEEAEKDAAAKAKFIKDETRKLKNPNDKIPPVPTFMNGQPMVPTFTRTLSSRHKGLMQARSAAHVLRSHDPITPHAEHIVCYDVSPPMLPVSLIFAPPPLCSQLVSEQQTAIDELQPALNLYKVRDYR